MIKLTFEIGNTIWERLQKDCDKKTKPYSVSTGSGYIEDMKTYWADDIFTLPNGTPFLRIRTERIDVEYSHLWDDETMSKAISLRKSMKSEYWLIGASDFEEVEGNDGPINS